MAAFEYEALDPSGRVKRGVVSADSARLARQELRRSQLTPVSVHLAQTRSTLKLPISLPSERLSAKDLVLVTRQLATMIDAAAPVEEALQTIAAQAEKPQVRKVLTSVRASVMEGKRLSDALAAYENTFNPLYRSLVAAGESSGTLGPVLDRLALHLEKSHRMRVKVRSALIYPIALAVTAALVVAGLMTFVVPKVVEQFDSLGQELPLLTQAVMTLSGIMTHYGLLILGLGVLGVIATRLMLKQPHIRSGVDAAILKLPIIGRLVRNLQSARLARTLSTLVGSGVPVIDGLLASRATLGNLVVADAVTRVGTLVREGASLSHALRQCGVFSPMVIYMVATGERSGALDDMLAKAADHLESEFEEVTDATLSLLEPAIIIVMGGVVAAIVFSILMPILQLNSLALI